MRSIYHNEERLESVLKRIKNSPDITERNKKLVFKFKDDLFVTGRSTPRILFYMNRFWQICRWIDKDFEEMTKEDLKELIQKIWSMDYAPRSKSDYNSCIKRFYRWLEGDDDEEYPAKVKWIKTSRGLHQKRLPEEMLTKEEVQKMIRTTSILRDKAFISILYESGCRIGEILTLKQKNVEFDEHGAVIRVYGKTGSRRVRLISSVAYLSTWMENHPNQDSHEGPLWVCVGSTNHGEQIMYSGTVRMLQRLGKKAGIKKKVNPHSFRHARATHLASKLTEAQMKEFFGWTQDSKQASTYVHLSGRDIDNAILQMHGKLPIDAEKTNGELHPQICARCKYENAPESEFCGRCRLPLTIEKALDAEQKEKDLMKMVSPEMFEQLVKKMVMEVFSDKEKMKKISKELN